MKIVTTSHLRKMNQNIMKQSIFLVAPQEEGKFSFLGIRAIRHFELEGENLTLISKKPKTIQFKEVNNDQLLLQKLISFLPDTILNRDEWTLVRAPFAANQYYPRIYRPIYYPPSNLHMRTVTSSMFPPANLEHVSGAVFQLASLINSMRTIFQVISPDASNLKAYGTEIRNVLITASTEFEAQCKGILKANGYKQKRWTTNDYVKLLSPMKLSSYSVKISPYSSISNRVPFKKWNSVKPTASLNWYDAYNKTKHDRESNLNLANLENAIDAVGACAIILFAQYGKFPIKDPIVDYMVKIINKPKWSSFKSYSKIGYSNDDWEMIKFKF